MTVQEHAAAIRAAADALNAAMRAAAEECAIETRPDWLVSHTFSGVPIARIEPEIRARL